jgi:hypothetical protein
MMDDLERPIPGYSGPRIVKVGAGTYNPEWTPVIRDVVADPYPYTYTPGGKNAAFILRPGVQVWGGYTDEGEDIDETTRKSRFGPYGDVASAYKAILSGDLNDNGGIPDTSDAYHVVLGVDIPANSGTVLDGLTIIGGNADGSSFPYTVGTANIASEIGGGMHNDNASPKLTRITISGNKASNPYGDCFGGGMYNGGGSSPVLEGVTISGNQADYGGGIYNSGSSPVLEDVTISGNQAVYGGGMYNSGSSPALINVTISGNTADNNGGGMLNNNSSSPLMINVTISGNIANYNGIGTGNGGGMYNDNSSSPSLINVTISGNTADYGGGIYNYGSGSSTSPSLINVTISGNATTNGGGGICNYFSDPSIKNSIIWGNRAGSDPGISNVSSTPTVAYSMVEGYSGGTGNVAAPSPIDAAHSPFADWKDPAGYTMPNSDGDYSLSANTNPAIDAGSSGSYPPSASALGASSYEARLAIDSALPWDLAGNTRVQGTAIDMGAYEKE